MIENLVSFNFPITNLKRDSSVFEESITFNILLLSVVFKLDWVFYIVCMVQTEPPLIKMEPWFVFRSLFLKFYSISIKLSFEHTQKNRYVGLMYPHLLVLLNFWFISKMLSALVILVVLFY